MSVMAHELKNVTAPEVKVLQAFFRGYDYRGAGYTFISHYIWRNSYCVSWEIIEGYLCLAGTKCSKEDADVFMAMPLICCPNELKALEDSGALGALESKELTKHEFRTEYEPESLKAAIEECKCRFRDAGREFLLYIPGHMRDIIEEAYGEVEFIHEVDNDEYVYLKEKLITLSGRALHKKKNHLNFFLRNYEYEAKRITKEMREDILSLAAEIRDFKAQDEDEVEDIESEYEAIEEILKLLDSPEVYGVGIYINDKLEAFAIGEVISETLACEHFEKANDEFRGLYQLVCSEFCKILPESIEFVNREEDMGLPNLRQAKEALKPDHMDERYSVNLP